MKEQEVIDLVYELNSFLYKQVQLFNVDSKYDPYEGFFQLQYHSDGFMGYITFAEFPIWTEDEDRFDTIEEMKEWLKKEFNTLIDRIKIYKL